MRTTAKAFHYLVVIILVLLISTVSLAQIKSLKGVQLNDGTLVYGKVMKMSANEVVIEDNDGKVVKVKFDDIKSFIGYGKDGEDKLILKKTGDIGDVGDRKIPRKFHDVGMYIGFLGGVVFPQDLKINNDVAGGPSVNDISLNKGYLVGAKFGVYPFPDRVLAIEWEYNHLANTDADTQYAYTSGGVNVNLEGKLTADSIFINFKLRYPEGKLHPYIGFGPGWSWVKFADVRSSANVGGATFITSKQDDSDNRFAYQVLAGVDIDIVSNLALSLGYKYYHVEPSLSKFQVDLRYSAHIGTIGLNFMF